MEEKDMLTPVTPVTPEELFKKLVVDFKGSEFKIQTQNKKNLSLCFQEGVDVDSALKTALELGYKVQKAGQRSIKFIQTKDAVSQESKTTAVMAGCITTSKVRLSDSSKGGMKNHITIAGEAFISLLKGVQPNRFLEAVLVVMDGMSVSSRNAFVRSVAKRAGLSVDRKSISNEDQELLAKVKKFKNEITSK